MVQKIIRQRFDQLRNYCEDQEFRGWDPYDGLNSKVFRSTPLRKNRLFRLLWIQFFKRSPFNLRNLLQVPKGYNPQALGLFISGYCNLYYLNESPALLKRIEALLGSLLQLESEDWKGSCWGYNFDWQARAFFQPKFSPTVVASTFAGYGLLDAYDLLKQEHLLNRARSICDFILNDLNRPYEDGSMTCFSYSPLDNTVVFNASLLASRMLSRVYNYTKEKELITNARKAVQFACEHQHKDGSWSYGTKPYHQWIDSFHTGYNLECIAEYQKFSKDYSFEDQLNKGLQFYIDTHFTPDGIPKYYHDRQFPIDLNCPAQLIIVLSRLGKFRQQLSLIERVLKWTLEHMQSNAGYFFYQKHRFYMNKIPYMRWSQAWMFLALTVYLREKTSI